MAAAGSSAFRLNKFDHSYCGIVVLINLTIAEKPSLENIESFANICPLFALAFFITFSEVEVSMIDKLTGSVIFSK